MKLISTNEKRLRCTQRINKTKCEYERILDKDVVDNSVDEISMLYLKQILSEELNQFSLREKYDELKNLLASVRFIQDSNISFLFSDSHKSVTLETASFQAAINAKLLAYFNYSKFDKEATYNFDNGYIKSFYDNDQAISEMMQSNPDALQNFFEEATRVSQYYGSVINRDGVDVLNKNKFSGRVTATSSYKLSYDPFGSHLDSRIHIPLDIDVRNYPEVKAFRAYVNQYENDIAARLSAEVSKLDPFYRVRVYKHFKNN